ncbi:polyamine oxidase 1-like isoform X2 [Tasmannia lanceolata]|uniref:polyamine oxidase 1-like isoform X2 n=1 Tax=Tasmannia lanceolata TaxID=3420 RepID=UPI0040644239
MVALEREKMVFLVVTLAIGIHFTATAALEPSVIIVGAGMSGISAGKRLSDAGIKNIVILEATNWIGGRIHKQNFAGLSVEIGANWVEGVHGEQMNPIWEMVNKLNLKTFFSNYDNLSSNTYQQAGGLYKESFAQQAFDVADSLAEFSRNISTSLTASREEDISILASQRLKNLVPSAPIEMAIDYYNYDYEFAEPPRVTSLQNTEPLPTFSNFGEDLYFVADPRGYESVVYYVAKQYLTSNSAGQITDSRVKLNKVVREIRHSQSGVIVKTEDGAVFRADYVMVSASIGVLQTNLINFQPDLPQLEREYPGANVLLVTVTDDESRRIEQQPDYETKAEIMEVLRNMFGKNVPEATDILIPKWWSNRFYKGTFSNWPIGVSRYEYDQIRVPVGRVYFTGEHTSEHYNGYVHGAYLAGIDSANMLIRCIKTNFCKFPIAAKGT